ncbi:MAG TPA: hypothetical protein VK154_17910 [Chitinophagales bacterium]|nr:hypothetical protein [Chitinophagales bacterium]
MKIAFACILTLAIATCAAQDAGRQHKSIVLPWYDAPATATPADNAKVVMLEAPLVQGDTIWLGNTSMRLQRAQFTFSTLGEVNETDLQSNVVTKNVATILDDAAGDRNALLLLDIDSCVDQQGKAHKTYLSYRLRYR